MISIDILPDDVLLEIFHFHLDEVSNDHNHEKEAMEAWQSLVHVCWRWRSVVFGSPRRLDLRLVFTAKTPAKDTLDVWPALPLVIQDYHCGTGSMDNVIALLERSDLVRRTIGINLWDVPSSQLQVISEAMQVPFPELTYLVLYRSDKTEPVPPFPDSFLGGFAPRLKFLVLRHIPYLGLPKLLLSATHLTHLQLYSIPHSGYISPEALVVCLSTLAGLEGLALGFESPRSRPDWKCQRPPLPTRVIFPVLRGLEFTGVGEYLEHLVARIDAPRVRGMQITLFNDIIFVTPQLTRFISHTPRLEAFNEAKVNLGYDIAGIKLSSGINPTPGYRELRMSISCRELDWQISFLEEVCTSSLPLLSTKDLYMSGRPWPHDWRDNIDYAQWMGLLQSFTAVKNLYLSKELAPCVVPVLQELVGGRTTEAFPTLQNIFLEELQESGPVQEDIGKLVAARQVTSHPIAVSRWDRDSH